MTAAARLAIIVNHLRLSSKFNNQMTTSNDVPGWQRVIEQALEDDRFAIVYQIATVETSGKATGGPAPHVRSVGHRGILSPISPAHPILITTTDARTPKAAQIAQNGRVEIAWWFPKPREQFRITGTAYILPAPDFKLAGAETASEERKREIEDAVSKLRSSFPGKELGGEGFDWEKERRAKFDSMSGYIRASWARPVPGSRVVDPNAAIKWPKTLPTIEDAVKAGGETNALVQVALNNVALVVIDPVEVDYVELAVIPNRRTRFYKEGEEWKEEAVVP